MTMKTIILVFFILFSSLLSAQEKKEIIVTTESCKGAANRDGSGLYWDIMKMVYEPLGYSITKKFNTYNKSALMLELNKADVHLGSYIDSNEFALYPKYYFDQDIVVAIFRNDSVEEWKGKKSLQDLKVGWLRGHDYDKYLSVYVKAKELSTVENGLKLLGNEHLDAFLDDRDNLKNYLSHSKLNNKEFTKKTIMQLKLYPAFAKTSQGEKLRKIWDKQMESLIETEEFKQLYFNSEYALSPY